MAKGTDNETQRLEAFSDGVFAVAITLLALSLQVPSGPEPLSEKLLKIWPSYVGFAVSFFTILIMWLNHHRLFRLIHKHDEWLAVVNGVLLLVVTFIPFPTSVLASTIGGPDARVGCLFYSGTFIVLALAFNLLRLRIFKLRELHGFEEHHETALTIARQYAVGPALYILATIVGVWSIGWCLAINVGLAVFFAIPDLNPNKG